MVKKQDLRMDLKVSRVFICLMYEGNEFHDSVVKQENEWSSLVLQQC